MARQMPGHRKGDADIVDTVTPQMPATSPCAVISGWHPALELIAKVYWGTLKSESSF